MNNYYFCVKVVNNLNTLIFLLCTCNNYTQICMCDNITDISIKNNFLLTKEIDRNNYNRYLRIYQNNNLGILNNKNNIASLNYHIINNNINIVNLISENSNLLLAFIYFCINIAKNKKITKVIFNINISLEFYFILFKTFQLIIYNIKYYNDNFIVFNGYLSFLNM